MRKTIPIVVGTTLASLALTGAAAQAQTTVCQSGGSYPTQNITLNGVPNAEIVATNAFGVASNGGTLCLDVTTTTSDTGTAGDFRISTNTSTSLNYPNILKGQSYGEGPTNQSGMPIQVSQITSLPTGWDVKTPTPSSTERWNNAIEFWLTTTKPTGRVNQADGTELMIWLNSSGDITPFGGVLGQVTIAGVLWDVHVGRASWGLAGGPIYWNYIAYAPADVGGVRNRLSSIHTDFKAFFDDAKTRTGDCRTAASYTAGNDNAPLGPCVSNSWWVTSVQAGFEVWQNGVGLESRSFTSMVNGVNTDRTGSDGRPIVNWSVPFDITQAGCSGGGGSATYAVYMPPGSTTAVQEGNMTLDSASNVFKATIAPVYPNHGDAQLRVNLTCPGTGTTTTNTNFYVDPSGQVTNSNNGQPIQGATVTLYYATTASGPFTVVPNGSIIMSPTNRRNPDLTSADGHYGWDVQNGQFYRVRAQKAGCTSPTNPSIPYVESPVVFVPPAVLDLDLQLSCPVQSANVVTFTDWGSGYCANVYVTNNSSVPWAWTATLPIDGTIYNIWNATSSANSGTATMQGIAWNKMLAPGATTYSVGFCANRNAPPQPPGTPSVSITKTSDWGTGYCETVTVTNNTSARITWNVTIPVEGYIYNAWNAVYTPMGGGQVSMHGVSWNSSLAPGESTHDVGFCANR